MDRREADLSATPEQRLESIQSQIEDDPFAAIRDKIEGTQAHVDAVDELGQLGESAEVASDAAAHKANDIVDAEIVPEDPIPPTGA